MYKKGEKNKKDDRDSYGRPSTVIRDQFGFTKRISAVTVAGKTTYVETFMRPGDYDENGL